MKSTKLPYAAIVFLFSMLLMTSNAMALMLHVSENKYISYTDVGQGEPLVLVHAFPTDERLWQPQQEKLSKKFRVITLDLWGFGQSSPVTGSAVTMTDYADEIKQLLDQLQIKKVILGGESMGGYVALAFLEKYPDQVSGLILSDTQSILDNDEAKIKREEKALDVLQHGTSQLIDGFMTKALTSHASDQIQEYLRGILVSQSPEAMASALRGMALRQDLSNLLLNTQLPVLIITGAEDTLISPEQSQSMHQLVKNSKLIIIQNAAHLSSLEQPEQWNQAVIDTFFHSKIN